MAITSTERSSMQDSPVPTIIQTPVQFKNINIVIILVSSVATGLLLLLCTVIFIVILLCATIRKKQRNKIGLFLVLHCSNTIFFHFFHRNRYHR